MIRKGSSLRWLYFFLGFFIAASVGLAIALAVVELKNDDDNQPTVAAVTTATGRPFAATERPNVVIGRPNAATTRPNPG